MKYDALFSPFEIKNLKMKNRIVLPAMMTKMGTPRSGEVTQTLIDYHVAIAQGGCGLNITEVCAIDKSTHGAGYLGLYEDYHEASLKRLVDAVHQVDGKICAQIWHGGMVAVALLDPEQKPMLTNDMDKNDIDYIIKKYGEATKRAVRAGVDAIEFHAAHTYLPHTFLSAFFNKRQDEYGGSLENRARFMLEVIREMKKNMPEDMPLFMRIDCFDDLKEDALTIDDIIQVLLWAKEAGMDVVDVSRGNSSQGLIYEVPSIETPRAYNVDNFAKIKAETGLPVVGVGRVNDPKLANDIIAQEEADLIAIGRAQIVDHEFANKAREGRDEDIRKCVACNTGCFDAIMDPTLPTITCLRNPSVGKEARTIEATDNPKKVMVIGGGLAGLMASSVLKERGHNPSLYEASDRLGGQFVLAGRAPGHKEMEEATVWEANRAKKLGVDIRMNTRVDRELIAREQPDEVIIATGAIPSLPKIDGINNPKVVTFEDVLDNKVDVNGRVVILGGKIVGLNVANYLAAKGATCTIIESESRVGSDLGWVRLMNQMTSLYMNQIQAITDASPLKIEEEELIYSSQGKEEKVAYDYIVVTGKKSLPTDDLVEECEKLEIPFYVIGDAESPRKARFATSEGRAAAIRI